jgi:hypothetical protein
LTGKYKPGQPLPADSRAADPRQNMFLNQGRLDEALLERVQKLQPIAEREGMTMAQLALAWILQRSEVSSDIIGASRPAQVEENAGASGKRLSEETMAQINALFPLLPIMAVETGPLPPPPPYRLLFCWRSRISSRMRSICSCISSIFFNRSRITSTPARLTPISCVNRRICLNRSISASE